MISAVLQAIESPCKGADKLVLILLADHSHDGITCFPSISKVAERAGVSKSSVNRSINRLISAGLVSRRSRTRVNGSRSSNEYRLTLPELVIHGSK
jgi:predicted transcriptional regulator